jgi:aspartyl-tRNA(Asn)/glutamyl-tRNA(Gln) amidotransferase subunit A
MELTNLSIAEAKKHMEDGAFTPLELLEAYMKRVEKFQNLNAFTEMTYDMAKQQAIEAGKRIKAGEGRLIDGMPVAVKGLFCDKGVTTTAGSKMLENFKPQYTSFVTEQLYKNGGVRIGTTNMDEFAMGSTNQTSFHGPVINPWKSNAHDKPLVPGGSSGGSAAAVAAHMCIGGLGSDTGGSIRQPGAFCGIVGVKPTYGRCSRYGMVGFASSLDQAGVFGRSIHDAALLLEAISGHDKRDSTSSNVAVPHFAGAIGKGVKGLKIGIPKEFICNELEQDIFANWKQVQAELQARGAEIVEITLPHSMDALPTYYILAPAEASSNLARYDGVRYGFRCDEADLDNIYDLYEKSRAEGFGREVKRRIMIGTYALSSGHYEVYYTKAQQLRTRVCEDFDEAFKIVDVILTPSTPTTAFPLDRDNTDDTIGVYLNDLLTVPVNLAGLPAISLPTGLNSFGLPMGMQLIAPKFDEEMMIRVGYEIEQAVGFQALKI